MRPPGDPFVVAPSAPRDLCWHVAGVVLNGAVVVAGVAWLVAAARGGLPRGLSSWWILGGVLLGMYVADLVSGVLHWAFDTWFDADVAFLRRMVLRVREHHIYPQRIFDIAFYDDAGPLSWIALALIAPIVGGAMLNGPSPRGIFLVVAAVVFSPLLVFMLVFHKCGHRAKNPLLVRWLQRSGLLLSNRHHMQHHGGNHDFNYCIVNGWADRTLGRLGLFRGLEWIVERTTGARPQRDDHEWLRRFGRQVHPRQAHAARRHGD